MGNIMPVRKNPIIPGEYYHVFNRGINSEIVFRSERNYHFFLRRMNEYIQQDTAFILAYVLMPTHYHILIHNTGEDFSACMGKLSISYTKAINIEWGRTGPLFESRFKSKLVKQDEYMLQLSR